jgi:hypothetical protein
MVLSGALQGSSSPLILPQTISLPERMKVWIGELAKAVTYPRGKALLPFASSPKIYPGIGTVLQFFNAEHELLKAV